MNAPLSDSVIVAVSRLVNDAQTETRAPHHADLDFQIERAGLKNADPKTQGQTVGKTKRLSRTLSWALENDYEAGQKLVSGMISFLRGCGGFRDTSPNFVGEQEVVDARAVFRLEGFDLTADGELTQLVLDNLSGVALTSALEGYIRRAKRGVQDAALVIGTGKDLMEATAGHILVERFGTYSTSSNFPTLLGQAFNEVGMSTSAEAATPGEPAHKRLERSMYDVACAVNSLRNKEGTGHGRPWLPTVSEAQARVAIQFMGTIAESMLEAHRRKI